MLDLLSLGFSVPIATVGGGALGWFLDRRLDTGPWLFLIGLALGIAAGIRNVIRAASAFAEDGRSESPQDPPGKASP